MKIKFKIKDKIKIGDKVTPLRELVIAQGWNTEVWEHLFDKEHTVTGFHHKDENSLLLNNDPLSGYSALAFKKITES